MSQKSLLPIIPDARDEVVGSCEFAYSTIVTMNWGWKWKKLATTRKHFMSKEIPLMESFCSMFWWNGHFRSSRRARFLELIKLKTYCHVIGEEPVFGIGQQWPLDQVLNRVGRMAHRRPKVNRNQLFTPVVCKPKDVKCILQRDPKNSSST